MEQSEDEVKIIGCTTGKIKAMKISLSVLALEILQNSLCNRGKYAFNFKPLECQRAWSKGSIMDNTMRVST